MGVYYLKSFNLTKEILNNNNELTILEELSNLYDDLEIINTRYNIKGFKSNLIWDDIDFLSLEKSCFCCSNYELLLRGTKKYNGFNIITKEELVVNSLDNITSLLTERGVNLEKIQEFVKNI